MKKNQKMIVGGLVAVILATAIGVFFYAYSDSKKNQISQNPSGETAQLTQEARSEDIANAAEQLTDQQAVADTVQEISTEEQKKIEEAEAEETKEEAENKPDTYAVEPLPAPAIEAPGKKIKIGLINDIHITSASTSAGRKINLKNWNTINYFVRQMNNQFRPNAIVLNGDIIEGTGRPASVGMEELRQTKAAMDQTRIAKYWNIGNHDVRSVTKAQWQSSLGINYNHKSFTLGNYHIIMLDSNFYDEDTNAGPGKGLTDGTLSDKEFAWLKKELKSNNKPKLVFAHHVFSVSSDFSRRLINDSENIRDLFSENNVIAVFSGHLETLYSKKVDGVKYFIVPGARSNEKAYRQAFAEITVNDESVSVVLNYINSSGTYVTKKM